MGERPTDRHNVAAAAGNSHPSLIVVGYGNTLRGDDGLGPQVAHTVEAWHLPGVAAVAVHQLTPELAAALAHYDYAIFVDARHAATADSLASVSIQLLEPTLHHSHHTHIASPEHMLALARALYGDCPHSWLVSIPAQRFDVGAPLSAAAEQRYHVALEVVRFMITTQRSHHLPAP